MTDSKNKTLRKIVAQKPKAMSTSKGYLPHVGFDYKQLPEAKNWEVGKTYTLTLLVKQVGKTEDDYGSRADFEIIKVGVGEEKGEE